MQIVPCLSFISVLCRITLVALLSPIVAAFAADARVYVVHQAGQKAAAAAALARAQARTHHAFDDLNAIAVTIPEQSRTALERNPAITLVEDDPVRGYLSVTLASQVTPYGISMVQAPAAVASGADGTGIKVGVVDSGVLSGHRDFAGLVITGEPDFGPLDQRTWYRDYNSHGTHVVGTIAAAGNNEGVVGVSPGKLAIHMVKVFGDSGSWVYSSDLLSACRAAQIQGCRIISMSLGGSFKSRTEENGLADLYNNKKVLLIAAAGNAGNTSVSYPAGYATVMSVAAVDSTKVLASFSQRNSDVEIAAPGVSVLSTVSYVDATSVSVGAVETSGGHIELSARGSSAGFLVDGGLGTAVNPGWAGKVVLLDRGTNSFYDKVLNVQNSGGVAAVIANNVSGDFLGTLGTGNSSSIVAMSVSQENGSVLRNLLGQTATVSSQLQDQASGYDYFDGTSMATPHVAGVAALIWSKYPGASNAQVRQALTSSAEDLGAVGRDTSYGFGLVRASNALSALQALNPPLPDAVAPVILSGPSHTVTSSKNSTFDITWTTDEASTSDVTLNGTLSANATLVTSHKRSFRGSKGATIRYAVTSRDAAGNAVTSVEKSFTLP
jgi:serine protease